MTARMPTELQCEAHSLQALAAATVEGICQLPMMFGALTGWAVAAPGVAMANLEAEELLLQARTLSFNAQRLNVLAATQADDARFLYSLTIELVDLVRMVRAEVKKHSSAHDLASLCEEKLATLQECIAQQFPGEACVGD